MIDDISLWHPVQNPPIPSFVSFLWSIWYQPHHVYFGVNNTVLMQPIETGSFGVMTMNVASWDCPFWCNDRQCNHMRLSLLVLWPWMELHEVVPLTHETFLFGVTMNKASKNCRIWCYDLWIQPHETVSLVLWLWIQSQKTVTFGVMTMKTTSWDCPFWCYDYECSLRRLTYLAVSWFLSLSHSPHSEASSKKI